MAAVPPGQSSSPTQIAPRKSATRRCFWRAWRRRLLHMIAWPEPTRHAIMCNNRRRHARQKQRLVADLRGAICVGDELWPGGTAAIAAAQAKRPLTGVLERFSQP